MDGFMEELAAGFARIDADGGTRRDELFRELRATLSSIAYLRTLIRDVDRELDLTRAA
jgi:hypothetical protein